MPTENIHGHSFIIDLTIFQFFLMLTPPKKSLTTHCLLALLTFNCFSFRTMWRRGLKNLHFSSFYRHPVILSCFLRDEEVHFCRTCIYEMFILNIRNIETNSLMISPCKNKPKISSSHRKIYVCLSGEMNLVKRLCHEIWKYEIFTSNDEVWDVERGNYFLWWSDQGKNAKNVKPRSKGSNVWMMMGFSFT